LKYVYFTQNNIKSRKYVEDKKGNVNMKIYKATVTPNGNWTNLQSLPFNSDYYSCAHPSLSEDNRILFFSSNMDNPNGASDLYWVTLYENGSIGNPEKLSNKINSTSRDNFPYVVGNWLYFSSDRPGGKGGLDIYKVDLSNFDALPINAGAPLNSENDDFGLVMEREMKQGYFTSNRTGGEGEDDIFFFKRLDTLKDCKQWISGFVYDSITKKPLHNAQVEIFSKDNIKLASFTTSVNGFYKFDSPCNDQYQITGAATNYDSKHYDIQFTPYFFKKEVDMYLNFKVATIEPETVKKSESLTIIRNNKEILNLPTVYFNIDEHILTDEGKKTVEKAVDILLQHPEFNIEFACHTDTRASFSYNLHLSDLRAQEVLKYMLKFGIDPDRIVGKGYGETHPVNKCIDNVYCTEAEHMQNRRAEFVVIKK
jgi:outer membrane protein OmpA-like peptidoglycan-associated protein